MHQLALIADEPPPSTAGDDPRGKRIRIIKPTIAPSQARCYADLVRMLIARRRNLGLCLLEVDHRAGFADGHTSKLEAPERAYGRMPAGISLELWLGALDVAIQLKPLNSRPQRHTLANPLQLELFPNLPKSMPEDIFPMTTKTQRHSPSPPRALCDPNPTPQLARGPSSSRREQDQ